MYSLYLSISLFDNVVVEVFGVGELRPLILLFTNIDLIVNRD